MLVKIIEILIKEYFKRTRKLYINFDPYGDRQSLPDYSNKNNLIFKWKMKHFETTGV